MWSLSLFTLRRRDEGKLDSRRSHLCLKPMWYLSLCTLRLNDEIKLKSQLSHWDLIPSCFTSIWCMRLEIWLIFTFVTKKCVAFVTLFLSSWRVYGVVVECSHASHVYLNPSCLISCVNLFLNINQVFLGQFTLNFHSHLNFNKLCLASHLDLKEMYVTTWYH